MLEKKRVFFKESFLKSEVLSTNNGFDKYMLEGGTQGEALR